MADLAERAMVVRGSLMGVAIILSRAAEADDRISKWINGSANHCGGWSNELQPNRQNTK